MPKLAIDLNGAFEGLILHRQQVESIAQKAIRDATYAVYEEIHKQANRGLKKTRGIYKRNINQPVMGRLKGSITLTGQLPNMLEQGADAFDIKDGFKRSPKAKKTAGGGWYLTIPFRHATSGSIGESEAFSTVMDRPIHQMARQLKTTITLPFFGKVRQGGKISASDLQGSKFGMLKVRPLIEERSANLTPSQTAAYTHKAPTYAGLQRDRKFYGLVGQSQYKTFRRVSSRSASNSWIHKGFNARDFMIKALQTGNANDAVARSISNSLAELGF